MCVQDLFADIKVVCVYMRLFVYHYMIEFLQVWLIYTTPAVEAARNLLAPRRRLHTVALFFLCRLNVNLCKRTLEQHSTTVYIREVWRSLGFVGISLQLRELFGWNEGCQYEESSFETGRADCNYAIPCLVIRIAFCCRSNQPLLAPFRTA